MAVKSKRGPPTMDARKLLTILDKNERITKNARDLQRGAMPARSTSLSQSQCEERTVSN